MSAKPSMVDRVTRAIRLADSEMSNHHAMALAAIEAMREPTSPMVDAGWDVSCDERHVVGETWQAMIDAALAEGT